MPLHKYVITVMTFLCMIFAITEADEVFTGEPIHISLILIMIIFLTILNLAPLEGFKKIIVVFLSVLLIIFSALAVWQDISKLTAGIITYLEVIHIINGIAIGVFSAVFIFLMSKED